MAGHLFQFLTLLVEIQSSGVNIGAIIGSVVAILVICLLVIIVVFFLFRYNFLLT